MLNRPCAFLFRAEAVPQIGIFRLHPVCDPVASGCSPGEEKVEEAGGFTEKLLIDELVTGEKNFARHTAVV